MIIVASVSCIFGLGSPEDYKKMRRAPSASATKVDRDELLRRLVDLQYDRNDVDFKRGTFRVRGDSVEIYPAYEEFAYRIELFGDEVDAIDLINPITGDDARADTDQVFIFPAVHYVMPRGRTIERAVAAHRARSWTSRLIQLRSAGQAAGGPAARGPHASTTSR